METLTENTNSFNEKFNEEINERIKNYFNDFDHHGIRGLREDLKTMCISSLVDEDDEDGRDTLSWVYNKIDGILDLIEISKENEIRFNELKTKLIKAQS